MVSIINDRILYVESEKEPIASDSYIIKGHDSTWIYDVSSSDAAYREIEAIEGKKNIVISHFHPDHLGNISRINLDEATLYVSKQTYKYSNLGNIVEENMTIDDGQKFRIFRLPSSHAKGCLGLEVGNEFAFVGDAIYPMQKDNHKVYNIQLLKEQIEIIEELNANKIFISHAKKPFVRQEVVVAFLKKVYAKRSSDSNFIFERLF